MKKGHIHWIILAILASSMVIIALWWQKKGQCLPVASEPSITQPKLPQETPHATKHPEIETPRYKPKTFDLAGKIKGLSASQINQHLTLYDGYVKKRNEIEQNLLTVNRKNSASRTYSPFRSLKVAETYALNGSILHELYFENISTHPTTENDIGTLTKALIEKSYGSIKAFKDDFLDCAGVARGWVLSCFVLDNGLLHNYVLDEHNVRVPILVIPLLVLDVYEHAYMIDYGIHRQPYLEVFWNHINWHVVEERIKKWVEPLITGLHKK